MIDNDIKNHVVIGLGLGYFHMLLDKKLISQQEHSQLLKVFKIKMKKHMEQDPIESEEKLKEVYYD